MPSLLARLLALIAAIAMVTSMVPAAPAATTTGLDEQAAADWVLDALWEDEGLATEFPEQVVFPRDSHLALHTLDSHHTLGEVDAALAADAAEQMQLDYGGFLRAAGDVLGPWTGATAHAVLLSDEHGDPSTIDQQAAADFLIYMQNDDGGFGPRLSFGGVTPLRSSMEATHDAVAALEALGELNETIERDVLAFVAEHQQEDGGWPTHVNTQTSSVEGTYHALKTLGLLGELDPVTADEARSFLYSLEVATGGFFADADQTPCSGTVCQVDPEITTRSTSQAILALATVDGLDRANATTREQHVSWIGDRQADEEGRFHGGFESYETMDAPVVNYGRNTRMALEALSTLEATDAIDLEAAIAFLVDTQHEGSGGFAMWPGANSNALDTGPAMDALATLDALDEAPAQALANTLGRTQREDGSIHGPDWDHTASTQRTSAAVQALALTGNLDAVDERAAGDFLLDRQTDEGGFQETDSADADIVTTQAAIAALESLDRLEDADLDATASYLQDLQDEEDGYIAERGPSGYTPVWHTGLALRTLATIANTSAVDEDSAAAFLADQQREDGTYEDPFFAAHVTLGLAAIDQLDRIDGDATRSYLEQGQTERGGLAERVFYTQENAMSRHANVLAALDTLGAIDGGDADCEAEHRSPQPPREEAERDRCPRR